MAATKANKNRAVRQEALRDQLSNQGHLQHVIDIIDKIQDQSETIQSQELSALKVVIDTKVKLIGKYLPDLKAVEVTGAEGDDIVKSFAEMYAKPKP